MDGVERKPMKEDEMCDAEIMHADRTLFSSLLKYIVQAAPNDDPSDHVLATIGRNVGADRCYVYRFWEPGKTSMCTNTHEWCAEGIKPEIGGHQECNLADLVEFNACITSGRDFLFTDINAIDAGSREWLGQQGIQSLIATPLVGANGTICGFAGFDFVKAPCKEFTDRIIFNIHEAADLLLNCQRLHERDRMLLDLSQGKNEYEVNEREVENALLALQKDVRTMHPKQMLEIVRNRLDADVCYMVQDIRDSGGGTIYPEHALARSGWTNTQSWTIDSALGRALDARLMTSPFITFRESEIDWLKANVKREEPQTGLADSLKVIHSVGIRKDGRLVGVLCAGYTEERQLSRPLVDFLRQAALVIVSTLERISTYHDLNVALNIAHLKGDVVDFMFNHQNYEEIREFIGGKVREIADAQHLMLCSSDGVRNDWFDEDAPPCCHDCVKAAVNLGRELPQEFFSKGETVVVQEGSPLPDMNLPPYCPMKSSVISQFRKGDGWWRLVADYTRPHRHNMPEVARGLHVALELLAISYERERHEKTIARMQVHQRFRADMLAYSLSKDDLPALEDLMLHRLLELTACDYIAIHSVDGDHLMLHPNGELATCPNRCEACTFYQLMIPPLEDADHVIELNDTKNRAVPIPSECPAKSLEVVVVYSEGKPWGGIALHYLNRQSKISEDDRQTLKIAADVLTLALERHSAIVHLQAERDRVVEAEKARSYFFSSVSHDIRTPLNAVIGFSELLQDGGVPPDEAKQYFKMITSSGRTLLQLVNDILDLSQVDLGKLEFSLEPTDIGDLVREMAMMFQVKAKANDQVIEADIPELPRFMLDPYRFRQVFFNFIGNAVKYVGPCTIRVSVAYENGILKIVVADDGKGVTAEKAKRLMQPFVQADIKNRAEGSGLGLAICKRLVDIMHGTISIDTALGRGFVVHVEVPVAVAPEGEGTDKQAAPTAEIEAAALRGRVLVVDDSPVNRAVLSAMLKKFGITDIVLAEDGGAALAKLKEDPSFDLVMSDMWMPVMDGAELVKHIREDERLAQLKVCSITADVEARTVFKEQGFDSLLLKPVTIEKLKEVFRALSLRSDVRSHAM